MNTRAFVCGAITGALLGACQEQDAAERVHQRLNRLEAGMNTV